MIDKLTYEFVLVGEDSEYVLEPLYKYLTLHGYSAYELDFGISNLNSFLIKRDPKKKLIFVSSAHPILSLDWAQTYLPVFYEKYKSYIGTLELLKSLNPYITCYVPHDLSSPLNEDHLKENIYLNLFDLYCNPLPYTCEYHGYANIIDVGWIKYQKNSKNQSDLKFNKRCLFISMIEHLRWKYGNEGVLSYFLPLLTEETSVKFPKWHGIDKLEKLFAENSPAKIIPAEENSIDVISNHDCIIVNGTSSIIKEAQLMSKPVIVLGSHEGFASYEHHLAALRNYKNITIFDYRSPNAIPYNFTKNNTNSSSERNLSPFNFELFINEINRIIKRK